MGPDIFIVDSLPTDAPTENRIAVFRQDSQRLRQLSFGSEKKYLEISLAKTPYPGVWSLELWLGPTGELLEVTDVQGDPGRFTCCY